MTGGSRHLRLRIVTPLAPVHEAEDVLSLTAEDATGRFGLLPGHADFVTVLPVSVASWTDAAGARHHAALRGGTLGITGGREVAIATREAVLGDDLAALAHDVLRRFRAEVEQERVEHVDLTRLHLAAIRQLVAGMARGGAGGLP